MEDSYFCTQFTNNKSTKVLKVSHLTKDSLWSI